MSNTPITDDEWDTLIVSAPWDAAAEHMAQVARRLERELRFNEKVSKQIFAANERLKRELDEAREQLAANHKATDLIERMLYAERALADRLATSLDVLLEYVETGEGADHSDAHTASRSLAAWKEARRE